MRHTMMLAMLFALGAAGPAWSQHDTGGRGPSSREEIRRRLDERFTARVREELQLDDQQSSRLGEAATTFGGRRRAIESRERELRTALERQLQPGVAADRDSVARLTDSLVALRGAYAQTFRDEHREISTFLDPVQRARLYMMRERLMRRAHEVRGERGRGGEWHRGRRPIHSPRDSA